MVHRVENFIGGDGGCGVERRMEILVIKIGIGGKGSWEMVSLRGRKMSQSCFLEVEKKNGKSFVKQLWLGTRRSEILVEIKQFYC